MDKLYAYFTALERLYWRAAKTAVNTKLLKIKKPHSWERNALITVEVPNRLIDITLSTKNSSIIRIILDANENDSYNHYQLA